MLTFAAPAFLWALAALPVVVWLHLARRRRRNREVAGLFLWHRAREAAARRPRPRPTWLLLLQLLAVAALALALARPQVTVTVPPDRVLVVDASASMAARDPDGVRLDKARDAARALLDEGGRVALVRMGREARVAQPFSADRGAVAAALDELRAGDDRAEAGRALELARGLLAGGADAPGEVEGEGAAASGAAAGDGDAPTGDAPTGDAPTGSAAAGADDAPPAPAGEIHWISDAPPPSRAGGVSVHDVAGEGRNLGLVSFDVGFDRAYLALASSYPGPQQVLVELLRGEQVAASTDVLVPARGRIGVTLPVEPGSGVVRARVTPPAGDALALDDEAWAGARSLDVVLQTPFPALERALGAVPGTRVRVTSAARTVPTDLRVLTWSPDAGGAAGTGEGAPGGGGAPTSEAAGAAGEDRSTGGADPRAAALPPGHLLLLPDPDDAGETLRIDDWDRTDPLLRFVDLRDVRVTLAPGAASVMGDGGDDSVQVLARAFTEGGSVPLLTQREDDDGTVWRFAFHPSRSDLVLRPAFPALVVNLVRALQGEQRVQLGALLPEGARFGGEPAQRALRPGAYRLDDQTVYASLLSEEETRLPAPTSAAAEAEGGEAGAAAEPEARPAQAARRAVDLVPMLLAVALAALLAEWWWWSGGRLRRPWVHSGG